MSNGYISEEDVVQELKDLYDLYNRYDKVDHADDYIEPDYEVLNAIKIVVKQYLPQYDYIVWERSLPEPRK